MAAASFIIFREYYNTRNSQSTYKLSYNGKEEDKDEGDDDAATYSYQEEDKTIQEAAIQEQDIQDGAIQDHSCGSQRS
jgi:hypothetical protein